jgi:hypothetical protein
MIVGGHAIIEVRAVRERQTDARSDVCERARMAYVDVETTLHVGVADANR